MMDAALLGIVGTALTLSGFLARVIWEQQRAGVRVRAEDVMARVSVLESQIAGLCKRFDRIEDKLDRVLEQR